MAERRKFNWSAVAEQMQTQANPQKKNSGDEDARFYKPKIKDDGTFEAIIRFLPSPDTDLPYAVLYNHGFQGPEGKWFIENCQKTHGEDCPVCKHASKVWSSGDEENARRRFKKMSVFSNILIVKDPQVPENEGKVFLYRYGKKMFEQIKAKMIPAQGSIDEPVMVFDYDEGANYKLKIKTKIINDFRGAKKPVPNYDSSEFMSVSKLPDHVVEAVEANLYPLKPIISRDKFLSNEELVAKLNAVEGIAAPVTQASRAPAVDPLFQFEDEAPAPTPVVSKPSAKKPAPVAAASDDDEPDDFFAGLKKK